MIRIVRNLVPVLLLLGALVATLAPAAAQGISLDQAKAEGLVGERRNGYLGVVRAGPGVQALVDQINLKRRNHYMGIARQNGTNLQAVEAIVGQKLIGRAAPGQLVEGAGGGWVSK